MKEPEEAPTIGPSMTVVVKPKKNKKKEKK
jgi:hypothetical protein